MVLRMVVLSSLCLALCVDFAPSNSGAAAQIDATYTAYHGFNSALLFNRRKRVFVIVPDRANFENYLDGTRWEDSNYDEKREGLNCVLDAREPELVLLIPNRPGKVKRGRFEFDSDGSVVKEYKDGVGLVLEYSFDRRVGVKRISTYGGNRTGFVHVNFNLSHGPGLLRDCLLAGM